MMTSNSFTFAVEPFAYHATEAEEEEVGRRRQLIRRSRGAPRRRTAAKGAPRRLPGGRRRPHRPRQRWVGLSHAPLILAAPPAGSEQIRWVQSTLNQVMKLNLPVDGIMGVETRSALRSFQEKQGLPVDGIVGPETERALLAQRTGNPATPSDDAAAQNGDASAPGNNASAQNGDEPAAELTYGGAITGAGWTPEKLTPVPGMEKTSQAFRWKVIRIAETLKVDPNFLMAIMSFESGFDPAIRNPYSGATGLIQFMPTTAKKLGTTTDALARMTAEQQLDYVAQYFAPYRGRLKTLEDTYMAVLWPPAIGQDSQYVLFSAPSKEYQQNSGLDVNKDGKTTVAEAISFVRKKLGGTAPGGPTSTGRPTLRRGSRGEAVKDLQARLQGAGHDPGPIDGIFGSRTDAAVRSFQKAQAITVDGIVGPQTWGRLLGPTPGRGTTPSVPGGDVAAERWVLPADVRATGETQTIRYDSPPAWDNGKNCASGLTAGAAQLGDYIRANFPGVTSIGGFACRQNSANLAETSVHGTGRALDIMITPVSGRANSAAGDPIANWLVSNAAAIGVQFIIWNHTKWNGSYSGRKDAAYGGPNPHIDHIHVELNNDGAARKTPWFASGPSAPSGGELSGAHWVNQFPGSTKPADLVQPFRGNVERFIAALERAGATVQISSTLRPPNRVYLMHYAWRIAREGLNPASVPPKAGVNIRWVHTDANGNVNLAASRAAAEAMVKAYHMVDKAVIGSRHELGRAIDMTITWSGNLKIVNAQGEVVTITSTPRAGGKNRELHAVGATYGVKKLVKDPPDDPHWSDDGK